MKAVTFSIGLLLLLVDVHGQDHQGPCELVASIPVFDATGNGWTAFEPQSQAIEAGALVLTSGSFAMTQFDTRLEASSIQVTADVSEAVGVVVALRSQAEVRPNGYFLEVLTNGAVLMYVVVDGKEQVLEQIDSLPVAELLSICLRCDGNRLRGWVWPANEAPPEAPSIEVNDLGATFTQGRPRLGVRDGKVAFSDVMISGVSFRPKILHLALWKREPRIVLTLETMPGSVHRFEETVDRKEWRTQYLIEADPQADTTTIVVPGSFQEQATPLALTRVIDEATKEGTPRKSADFLFPTTRRVALTWESQDTLNYQFEYSVDLESWQRIEHLVVRGAAGERSTSTVLARPQDADQKSPLFFRVVEH